MVGAATKPGVGIGSSAPQPIDLARPCVPIILNFDHLISWYCVVYVKCPRLKLPNDVLQRSIVRHVRVCNCENFKSI